MAPTDRVSRDTAVPTARRRCAGHFGAGLHDPGPAAQELADHRIQTVVRMSPRFEQIGVDLAQRPRGTKERNRGRATLAEQQAARGLWTEVTHAREAFDAGHLGCPLIGYDESDRVSPVPRLLEPSESGYRRPVGQDPVIGSEPSLQRCRPVTPALRHRRRPGTGRGCPWLFLPVWPRGFASAEPGCYRSPAGALTDRAEEPPETLTSG